MKNYWLLSCGKDGELWPVFWSKKVIAIGWPALGDLSRYTTRDDLKQALKAKNGAAKPRNVGSSLSQLWNFCHGLQKEEIVFVRSYLALIGIAEIQGDYEFLPEGDPLRQELRSRAFGEEFCHIRRVRWLSLWGGLKQPKAFTKLTLMA